MSRAADKEPVEGVNDLRMGLLDLRARRGLDLRDFYLSSGKTEEPTDGSILSILPFEDQLAPADRQKPSRSRWRQLRRG